MSIYDLDLNTRKLLGLEYFQQEFTAKDFVEKLSQNHSDSIGGNPELIEGRKSLGNDDNSFSRSNGDDSGSHESHLAALDPKPYIRTFEFALQELQRLRLDTTLREQNLEKEAKSLELDYSQTVVNLSGNFDNIYSEFKYLDTRVDRLASSTAEVGKYLEEVDFFKKRSSETHFISKCFLSYVETKRCDELDRLWNSDSPQDKMKCADTVRQLLIISKKIVIADIDAVRSSIERMAETLEKELLNLFDDAYRGDDPNKFLIMKYCASILTDFNGGNSVIQVFVNQHPFFIVKEKILDSASVANTNSSLSTLANPDTDLSIIDDMATKLVEEIGTTMREETVYISLVFNKNPQEVILVFLERMFAQSIEERMESFLTSADSVSSLAYIRCLNAGYNAVSALVEELKVFFNEKNLDNDGAISLVLDQYFNDVFVPYIDNDNYLEREKKSIQEIIQNYLWSFQQNYNHTKLSREQSIFSRFTSSGDLLSGSPVSPGSVAGTPLQSASTSALDNSAADRSSTISDKGRIGNFMRMVGADRRSVTLNNEKSDSSINLEDFIQVEIIQKILRSVTESVKRVLELSNPGEASTEASDILDILLELVGKGYIEITVDMVISQLSQDAKSTDVDLGYFKSIRKVTISVFLLSQLVNTTLLPLANSSPTIKKQMVILMNTYLLRLEERINTCMQSYADFFNIRVAHILSKQKKRDYILDEDSIEEIKMGCTITGLEVLRFLDIVYHVARDSLDSSNFTHLLIEIGTRLRELLLENMLKFTITVSGGAIVLFEAKEYQQVVDRWNIKELSHSFSILIDLANMYATQPQGVAMLVKEGNLAKLTPSLMRQYLARRADYFTTNIHRLVNDSSSEQYIPSTPPTSYGFF
ncbi:hypothetical protein NADFUDRAFT_81429 [Nadsonia fulvescens var. elongata DSM 6958]|uniref:Uncharacterized protein n=1 Tax=Nadsonia fulvescens var. elongata DSM 6958 TaxID=857566 RepID=A0A1E3PSR1_9ASCO|nr:hypothetical protein NADFUDRAFT_81429 [Nadsonia fulvescens var. elongata DSM 6958]